MKLYDMIWRHAQYIAAFVLVCILNTTGIQAQCPTLSMQATYTPVEQLTLADVDVDHFESRSLLFAVHIMNYADSAQQVQLHVALDITLADGSLYDDAVYFTTEPFPVLPGETTVTNLDIGNTKKIKTESFNYDPEAKNRIQSVTLGTGFFPAGTYVFRISLEQINSPCPLVVSPPFEYVLENPSRVELHSPRDRETTNEFPFFDFFHDAQRSTLTVAELLPGQSREDAITNKPPMLEVNLDEQHSFLYAGGRPLEQGKIYVWQVVSKTRISGGTDNKVASPIWLFTVSNSASVESDDAILNQLEEMFGHRYAALFTQIRNGSFKLTGKYSDNNSRLSQSELLNLLNELRELSESAELAFE